MYDLWKWSTKIRLGSLLPTFLPPWGGCWSQIGNHILNELLPSQAHLLISWSHLCACPHGTPFTFLHPIFPSKGSLHFYILSFLQRAIQVPPSPGSHLLTSPVHSNPSTLWFYVSHFFGAINLHSFKPWIASYLMSLWICFYVEF